jgi:hypothetical protein
MRNTRFRGTAAFGIRVERHEQSQHWFRRIEPRWPGKLYHLPAIGYQQEGKAVDLGPVLPAEDQADLRTAATLGLDHDPWLAEEVLLTDQATVRQLAMTKGGLPLSPKYGPGEPSTIRTALSVTMT